MHYQGDLGGQGAVWGYVRGGMGMISFAIADAAREAGAVLACGVPVAMLPGEGVTLEDGTSIDARAVICNADPKGCWGCSATRRPPPGPPRRLAAPQPGRQVQRGAHPPAVMVAAPGQDFWARAMVDVTTGLDAAQRGFAGCARGEAAVGFGEIYVQTGYDPTPAARPPPDQRVRQVRALRVGLGRPPGGRWRGSSST